MVWLLLGLAWLTVSVGILGWMGAMCLLSILPLLAACITA